MPGSPQHALGHPLLTVLATTALAVIVVGSLRIARPQFDDPMRYAAAGGFAYATVYLALWAVVPAVFWRFVADPAGQPAVVAGSVLLGYLALALQAAVPLYAADRWLLWTPSLALAATSWACGYLFLQVGGESGATFLLLLWGVALAPTAIVATAAVAAVEAGVRRRRASGVA